VVCCGPVDPATTGAWCARVRATLEGGATRVVICDVGQIAGRASSVVDALARLQLTARRCGGEIRFRHASPGLLELLELVGLADVLGMCAGEPEGGEEPRV
jgi:anti-anti-sigma regulatory factor